MDQVTPALRFQTDTGDLYPTWQINRLKEIAEIHSGGTPATTQPKYWNGDIPWVTPTEITKNNKYIKQTKRSITEEGLLASSAYLLPENSILMTSRATIGSSAINTTPMATNQGFKSFIPTEKIDLDFLYYYLQTLEDEFKQLATGSTFLEISMNETENTNIYLPVPEEQKKIGEFLSGVDHLINLKEKEINKKKKIKSAYLTEIFPKKNKLIPKRRFSGFTKTWQNYLLKDLANNFDNLRIPVAASKRQAGNIPYYGANGIQDYVKGFTHEGEYILLAEDGANDLKNYPVHYVNEKIWVNNHAHVLQGKLGILDNKFLMYRLKKLNMEPYLVGGGRAKLNANVMMNIKLSVPKFEEQKKIGNFLSLIDQKIELKNQELEKIKKYKKAFLEKMFV